MNATPHSDEAHKEGDIVVQEVILEFPRASAGRIPEQNHQAGFGAEKGITSGRTTQGFWHRFDRSVDEVNSAICRTVSEKSYR
jgi:hypothetical protein